jgi:hypothetical protein
VAPEFDKAELKALPAEAFDRRLRECSAMSPERRDGHYGSLVSRSRLSVVFALLAVLGGVALGAAAGPPPGLTSPPPGLTSQGRTLWELEALLHDTFHDLPVSAHYDQGRDWRFAACGRVGCAPLAYWGIYFFTFRTAGHSTFHLSRRRSLPNVGNYPVPVKVAGRFVACNRAENRFLFNYESAAGFGFACFSTHG